MPLSGKQKTKGGAMQLWLEWFKCVFKLRKACSRTKTFIWMAFALIGFSTLPDQLGVTGLARASFLKKKLYHNFLHLFHSTGLDLSKLTSLWVSLALKLFRPVSHNGRIVLLLDGLKIPKEGKRMPGVKKLHQSSSNNSKAPYIYGHSLQVLALLVHSSLNLFYAIPLISRIHEGIVLSPLHKKSLPEKVHGLLASILEDLSVKILLIADAFYSNRKVILPLLEAGHHLLSRVRNNATAYEPAPKKTLRGRGRPKVYGKKVVLQDLFNQMESFQEAQVAVYGNGPVSVRFLTKDLLWKPVKRVVRFILVQHPERGRIILVTTDLEMDPSDAIRLYSARFKIEVSFKSAVHTVGAYVYRFWMKMWLPNKGRKGDQYLHKKSKKYREKTLAKIDSYHRFIQLAIIGQGLLLHLAINFRKVVWSMFPSWLRTMKVNKAPSELVVAHTLKFWYPEFLLGSNKAPAITKILEDQIDVTQIPGMTNAA